MLLAGLCTVDLVQRVAEFPGAGEAARKVQSRAVDVAAGGPATNAAVTVAALGGQATLLTVLGAHPLAGLARADLESCGVRVLDALPEHLAPPAVSAVVVRERDGERTVVSHNAAALGEKPAFCLPFDGQIADFLPVRAVLVDGHHPELALAAARWARASGVPVLLDAGSWKPVLDELLPLVDIAACSADFRAPGRSLHERGVPAVVTTNGPAPVRWSTLDDSGEVSVPRVRARDTLGAGDVWHGALAWGVGRFELPELIGFANEVAAERVRHAGPRSWTAAVRGLVAGLERGT
ncbi:PfkB family carbohydrate kinase [Amycolatopsis nigrescens]|uniref:PfkB family carbohydrate kinase n=1 Tax=Amycolatopsis nigrescens TaxID=381445 RepID=UPI0004757BF5|nr:PfkB family carbohydrate kinase [Amycolatopsis nigrescens]